MEGYKIPPVFANYQEALGRENIQLAVVEEHDGLDFVKKGDIVLLRTANLHLLDTIRKKDIKSTAESYWAYELTKDKEAIAKFLKVHGLLVPKQYMLSEIVDGMRYFVKPRYGGESFGITEDCICLTKADVEEQVRQFGGESEAVIEELISGVDCTVSCYKNGEEICTHPIVVECNAKEGIQTHKGKFDYNEFCYAMTGEERERANAISRNVFSVLKLEHHARIDFRKSTDGELYIIDVNLLPGLGPIAHYAKCLLLTANKSYRDSLMTIINSAS